MDSPMPAPPVSRERDFSPRQNRVNTRGRSLGGDADAGVRHLEQRIGAVAAHGDAHGAAGIGVAQGVREQVHDDLLEALGIAVDDRRMEDGRQRDALVGERVGERRRLRAGDGREVHGDGVEQQTGAFRLGERGQVVEQAGKAQRLVVHRREVGRLVLQDAVLRRLHAREDAHHRCAQLVGEVGDALLASDLPPPAVSRRGG